MTIAAKELLEQVKGVGPSTRQAVLGKYKDFDGLSKATVEELVAIKGVGQATAEAIVVAVAEARTTGDAEAVDVTVGEVSDAEVQAADTTAKATEKVADVKAEATTRAARAKDQADDKVSAAKAKAKDAADRSKAKADAEVRQLRTAREEVGEQADNLVMQVKGAVTSMTRILEAALAAGKEEWPNTERQLKAALTSLQKTGTTMVDAVKDMRKAG